MSGVFVPCVLAVAALTFLAWLAAGWAGLYPDSWLPRGHSHALFALLFGIAVLCVACPCALGLATPTAVMVGTGVGADLGVFIKSGAALERASQACLSEIVMSLQNKTGMFDFNRSGAARRILPVSGRSYMSWRH